MTQKRAKILLIYTGGTIGMVKDYETGALRAFDFDKLLNRIPELHQLDCDIETISFEEPIDSSEMDPSTWVLLVEIIEAHYHNYDGFVVLHGSDTMSYTSSAVSFMLEHLAKPVIFTGSQLPIGDLRTDAKENLITAVQIASLQDEGEPMVQEVCLYFEYKLYRANRTTKINAEHFQAFASLNYPALAESGVHLKVFKENLYKPITNHPLKVRKLLSTHIALIKLYPGISKEVIAAVINTPHLKAVIIETYGAGNAPTALWFMDLLRAAKEKGILIVNITQCSGGSVMMGHYATSKTLEEMQVINGKDITTESAVAKLMYLLGQNLSANVIKGSFEMSLRGEIN